MEGVGREGKARAGSGFVLRRDPEASLLESGRDAEFRVYQALQKTGVPVPEVFWLEEDPKWLERPFFVMGRLPGEASPQTLVARGELEPVAQQKVEILARIHALDWRALGLDFLGGPDSAAQSAEREIAAWERTMRAGAMQRQPVLELALAWIRAHTRVAPSFSIGHGE